MQGCKTVDELYYFTFDFTCTSLYAIIFGLRLFLVYIRHTRYVYGY